MNVKKLKISIMALHKAEIELRTLNQLSQQVRYKNKTLKTTVKKIGRLLADIWIGLEFLESKNEIKRNEIVDVLEQISKVALKVACTLEENHTSDREVKRVFLKRSIRTGFCQKQFQICDILSWPDEGLVLGMKKELLKIIDSLE